MLYDLVIPLAIKDVNKLKFLFNSFIENVTPQPENTYIIYEDGLHLKSTNNKIIAINERDLFDIDFQQIKFKRKGWILQQFIKLFQNVTKNNLYLIIDSDLIFNRPFELFKDDKLWFWLGNDQYHLPYFNLMKKLWNIDREYNYSFISEIMLFDRRLSQQLLGPFNDNPKELFDVLCQLIDHNGSQYLLGDYEIYGNWIYKHHREKYSIQKIKTKLLGHYRYWQEEEIQQAINGYKNEDIDTFTIHTWI